MKLTEAQYRNLRWLVDNGGSGYIDKHGRVVAGGKTASQGSWISWLHLIVKELIEGHEQRLRVTAYGMRHVKPTRDITVQENDRPTHVAEAMD